MSEWVSVDDQLPKRKSISRCFVVAEYSDGRRFIGVCSYLPKNGGFSHYHAKVVYWLPLDALPKPPEVVE